MTEPTTPTQIGIDPLTITLVGGMIVTIIGTLVSAACTIITALRVGSVKTQIDTVGTQQAANTTRIDAVAKDTESIKGHVNSEKTASEGRENALRVELALLREMLADKKATASLLAQATAQRGRSEPVASVAPADASLDRIDTNTAQIERNTASTETTVQDLKKEL